MVHAHIAAIALLIHVYYPLEDDITHNSGGPDRRTRRILKLSGGIDHLTCHALPLSSLQGQKVKGHGHKVRHQRQIRYNTLATKGSINFELDGNYQREGTTYDTLSKSIGQMIISKIRLTWSLSNEKSTKKVLKLPDDRSL